MKPDTLQKAVETAKLLAHQIRKAHSEACADDNQFAEIAIFDLIEPSVRMEHNLKRLVAAASVTP